MSIWPRWLQGLSINFLGLMMAHGYASYYHIYHSYIEFHNERSSQFYPQARSCAVTSSHRSCCEPSFAGHAHHTGADIRDRGRNRIAGHGFVLVVLGGLNGRPSLEILDAKICQRSLDKMILTIKYWAIKKLDLGKN